MVMIIHNKLSSSSKSFNPRERTFFFQISKQHFYIHISECGYPHHHEYHYRRLSWIHQKHVTYISIRNRCCKILCENYTSFYEKICDDSGPGSIKYFQIVIHLISLHTYTRSNFRGQTDCNLLIVIEGVQNIFQHHPLRPVVSVLEALLSVYSYHL